MSASEKNGTPPTTRHYPRLTRSGGYRDSPGAHYVDEYLLPALDREWEKENREKKERKEDEESGENDGDGLAAPEFAPTDFNTLADLIDAGDLIACPRCHFLHLPTRPFPNRWYMGREEEAPAVSCDVCALVPHTCAHLLSEYDEEQSAIDGAVGAAGWERLRRARALYALWIGADDGARMACWEAVATGLDALAAQIEQGAETAVAGEESSGRAS